MKKTTGGMLYHMEVLDAQGAVKGEVVKGDVVYVIANPGEEFSVRFKTSVTQPIMVTCNVDGLSCGYGYNYVSSPSKFITGALFSGWHAPNGTKRKFKFLSTVEQQRAGTSSKGHEQPSSVGSIEITVYQAEVNDCVGKKCFQCKRDREHYDSAGPRISSPVLGEDLGKKFFQKPSVGVGSGSLTEGSAFKRRSQHFRARFGCIPVRLVVQAETAEVLKLRGILDPNNPEHAPYCEPVKAPSTVAVPNAAEAPRIVEVPRVVGAPAIALVKAEPEAVGVSRKRGRGERVMPKGEPVCDYIDLARDYVDLSDSESAGGEADDEVLVWTQIKRPKAESVPLLLS